MIYKHLEPKFKALSLSTDKLWKNYVEERTQTTLHCNIPGFPAWQGFFELI